MYYIDGVVREDAFRKLLERAHMTNSDFERSILGDNVIGNRTAEAFPFLTEPFWRLVTDTAEKLSRYNFTKMLPHLYPSVTHHQAREMHENVLKMTEAFR